MEIPINYLAVLLAAVASMVIGAIWYSPALFSEPWAKDMGFTEKDEKLMKARGAWPWLLMFACSLLTAYVLARFVTGMPLRSALEFASWLFLGFTVTRELGMISWGKATFRLFLINSGYWLITFAAMTWILVVWV
ncbi:DUF1761 domain-containing protein [Candidatus Gracilibacteria bacterium]|nr:DUF1761 domain-containing protein [Candidatus Gracilibacteria bacterium]